MKEIYENNKFMIWIGIITIIVLITGLVIYFNMEDSSNENNTEVLFKDEYDLILFGSDVEIYQNEIYQEPGFYAILNNEIVTDKVSVDNPLDVSKIGTYEITYNYRNITRKRKVNVIENPYNQKEEPINNESYNIELKLNGDKEINLKINDKYQELGAKAIDSKGNDLSKEIKITNNINNKQVGSYKVIYSINKNNVSKTIERVVNVINNTSLKVNVSNKNKYTNEDIVVNVEVIGSNYLYMKLPDNTVTLDKKKEYLIKENGTYTFQAFDYDNSVQTERVTINNIDKIKPSGTCTATIDNSKTTIKVLASDNVGISYYKYNGKNNSNSNTYTYNSVINNPYVIVYDKASNEEKIYCSVNNKTEPVKKDDGNIEMHFITTSSDDDAILIRTNNKTIMIDGGRGGNATTKVTSYLKDLGVKKIDLLIGSHVHWNHIQAHGAIIENFQVEKAIYSLDIFNCQKNGTCDADDIKYVLNSLKKNKIPTEMKQPGDIIELGEMKLYFIGPIYPNKVHNKNSFVFILKYRNTSYMFTGDASESMIDVAKFQQNASKLGINLDVDVLKWPHHGYNNLTDSFFKETTPKYAIAPNGLKCSSKYPSDLNKKLMKKYGTKYYQTCEYRNIVLISNGKDIDIKTNQNAITYAR